MGVGEGGMICQTQCHLVISHPHQHHQSSSPTSHHQSTIIDHHHHHQSPSMFDSTQRFHVRPKAANPCTNHSSEFMLPHTGASSCVTQSSESMYVCPEAATPCVTRSSQSMYDSKHRAHVAPHGRESMSPEAMNPRATRRSDSMCEPKQPVHVRIKAASSCCHTQERVHV